MDDLIRLATDLAQAPERLIRQGRGAGAKVVDAARNDAQAKALGTWTTYGRGLAGSAGTFEARMSRNRSEIAGQVTVEGEGAFFQEHGTGHHPPQPVLGSAGESAADAWAAAIADVAEGLL